MTSPVLIVDDNPVNLFAMRALVERLGYAVIVASSGEEAVRLGTTQQLSAILLDLMMPEMTGYDVAKALRAKNVRTPIIAATALDATDAVRAAAHAAGIDEILTKPVDPPTLAAYLGRRTTFVPAGRPSSDLLRGLYGASDLKTITEAFFTVTRTLLQHLEEALAGQRDADAQRTVHELKSAAAQLYAGELAQLCNEIESARQNNDWAKMAKLYEALVKATNEVATAIAR